MLETDATSISVLTLAGERKPLVGANTEGLKEKNPKELELLGKLEKSLAPYRETMKRILGATFSQRKQQAELNLETEVDKQVVVDLLTAAYDALKQQQAVLTEYGDMTRSMDMDIAGDDGTLTITDFERALEFLDSNSPRTSSESFRRILNQILKEARSDVADLAVMPMRKPSFLYPRGLFSTPLFGVFDRSVWGKQYEATQKKSADQIAKVENFASNHVDEWAKKAVKIG